jgi:hypothetical protein
LLLLLLNMFSFTLTCSSPSIVMILNLGLFNDVLEKDNSCKSLVCYFCTSFPLYSLAILVHLPSLQTLMFYL